MATRATYAFKNDRTTLATLYIHYDGYPEGAANYFRQAAESNRRDWVGKMFHAAEYAEITGSHESHGDTEYRYTLDVDSNVLTAWKRYGDWDMPVWVEIFEGDIKEFIQKYQ